MNELIAQIERLRTELDELRAQLAEAQLHQAATMRARTRCPACHAQRVAHARTILDRGDGDSRKALALCQPSWWSSEVVGELEAFACTACGLVEWYVREPSALRNVGETLVLLDGSTPSEGPFR
jgi:hypothetical protein